MTKAELFRNLVKLYATSDSWLNTVPREINSVFFDNPAMDAMYNANTMLIREYFGEHAEAVEWFIYEWKPGYTVRAPESQDEIPINSIDEYVAYMKLYEGFPND